MQTSTALKFPLSAGAIVGLLAGCSGTGNTPSSSAAFAPPVQTSARQSVTRLEMTQCPAETRSPLYVNFRTAATYAVLAASTVTSAGYTLLNGNLGVSPGTAYTGFPPGIVVGSIHAGDAVAAQAQADLAKAYNYVVALKNPTLLPADIGGMTLAPGLYAAPVTLGISGTVTLDAQNKPGSLFVFQIPSTLTTAVNSKVVLINKASPCNIVWQVGSSATINAGSNFYGTVMTAASSSLGTGAIMTGKILAENGAITLLDNTISVP